MWTVTLDQSAIELLFLSLQLVLFIFFPLSPSSLSLLPFSPSLIGKEKKKIFFSYLCATKRLYEYVYVWEQAKRRILPSIVDNKTHREWSVRRFEIGRDKKNTATSVSMSHVRTGETRKTRTRQRANERRLELLNAKRCLIGEISRFLLFIVLMKISHGINECFLEWTKDNH